jgi:hypothetical protein
VRDKKEKNKTNALQTMQKNREENIAANYIKTYKTGRATTNPLHQH